MKTAKIIVNDIEIKIPVNDYVFEALCENSEQLENLSSDITCLLKRMFPLQTGKGHIIVGDAVLEFEAERYFLDALADSYQASSEISEFHIAQFSDEIRKTIPFKKRPPTYRQIEYVTEITTTLMIDIPAKVLTSTDACSEFIDEHQDEFKVVSQEQRAFLNEANRVARWAVADHLVSKSEDLKGVASKLGVAREATVEKYLKNFNDWKEQFYLADKLHQFKMWDMITSILEEDYSELGKIDLVLPIEPVNNFV